MWQIVKVMYMLVIENGLYCACMLAYNVRHMQPNYISHFAKLQCPKRIDPLVSCWLQTVLATDPFVLSFPLASQSRSNFWARQRPV